MDTTKEHCKICGRELDNPDDPFSENCEGDCLQCMADCGDPDCGAKVAKINGQVEPTRISMR